MRKELRFVFILFLLCILGSDAFAAKRYWVASAAGNWNSTSNWSATSGGAGGSSVPGSSDTAYFNSGGNHKCTINATVNIKRWEIASSFTDTISQGSNGITVGANAVLSGGKFIGGSSSITISGALTISGTAFTSTSGTLTIASGMAVTSGSFSHNSGTVVLSTTSTLTSSITGGTTFYNLTFSPAASNAVYTITSTSAINVSSTLTIAGTNAVMLNSGTINAKGDITITNSNNSVSGGGSALINISGTVRQTLTGSTSGGGYGRLPSVTVNKTTDTLVLVNTITITGDWTYTSGGVIVGSSTLYMLYTKTISGKQTFYNLYLVSGSSTVITLVSTDTLTVKGTFLITGALDVTVNSGVIYALGSINNSSSSSTGGGNATILITGTNNQTFTGSGTQNQGRFPNIKINKSGGTLTLSSTISVAGNWTYVSGTVNPGSSSVYFINSKTIAGDETLNNVIFSSGPFTYKIPPNDTLTTTGTLTLQGAGALTLDSGLIIAKGDVSVTNSGTSATGTASLIFAGSGTQNLTGSGTAGQGRLPKITIDKSGGSLTLASVISVYGDWIYKNGTVIPGNSTVVLYGTENLDGQILGGSTTMSFNALAINGATTLTGDIDVNNNLTIGSGSTLSAGSKTINLGGTWSNTGGTWTYGTSTLVFDGSSFSQIKRTVSGSPATETFYNVTFNRGNTGSQTLSNAVTINHNLTLTKGHVKALSTNYLELIDNATLTGGSDSAYVHGTVRKTGNDAFIFPLGDTTLHDTAYHPLAMTAPSSTSDQFEAVYFPTGQSYGSTMGSEFSSISGCEYWTFKKVTGSSTPTLSLNWNSNCDNYDYSEMLEGMWNGTQWSSLGQSSVTVLSTKTGKLTPTTAVSFTANPAPITIGFANNNKSFSALSKTLDGGFFSTDGYELYFGFTSEYNDLDGRLSYTVIDLNTNTPVSLLGNSNNNPVVNYGSNNFRIDLYDSSRTPLASGFYLLEVTNYKNEKWYLRFKI